MKQLSISHKGKPKYYVQNLMLYFPKKMSFMVDSRVQIIKFLLPLWGLCYQVFRKPMARVPFKLLLLLSNLLWKFWRNIVKLFAKHINFEKIKMRKRKRKVGDRFFSSFWTGESHYEVLFLWGFVWEGEKLCKNQTFAKLEARLRTHQGQWCPSSLSYLQLERKQKQRPGSLPNQ